MKTFRLMILLVATLAIVACQSIIMPSTPSTTVPTTTIIPSPEAGKASVTGRVLNSSGEPVSNTSVRLAEVYPNEEGDAAFALDEAFSPAALTDNQGFFLFNNIPAGEYVLFVGSINTEFMIIQNSDGSAVVYNALPDEILEIATITTSFN